MKIRLLTILTGLLLTLLTACTSTIEEPLEALANPLFGLSGTLLIQPDQGNCPVDELQIPGEKPRLNGSTGGLAVLNAPYENQPTSLTYPTGTGQYVQKVAALYGAPTRNTGILVVDDFQGGPFTLNQAVYDLQNESFPTDDPIARAEALQARLDELQEAGLVAHGPFVFNHINALLVAAGYTRISVGEAITGLARFRHTNGTRIYVKAVDIEDFDTSVIAQRVSQGLNALRRAPYFVSNIAVNMSFAVVPCSVLFDFDASDLPTFESYIDALLDSNPGSTLAQIRRAIITPVSPDPLYNLISGTLFQPSTVYIAAAGNYSLTFPMFPAAWPEVISIASHDVGSSGIATFSNRGEVMITGGWFRLTNPAGINGLMTNAPRVVYQGTSFSAPAAAVFTAIDLASSPPRCALQVALPTRPDLAYAPTLNDGIWTRKNVAFAANFNKLLKIAVQNKCGL
jgi:Subtilase family